MTSEQKHGISKQPESTCPMIDAVIAAIGNASKAVYRARKYDICTDADRELDEAQWLLDVGGVSPIAQLERIRKNAEALRAWGEEWKQLALEQHEELRKLEQLAEPRV